MTDPLAGFRRQLNERKIGTLRWPIAEFADCPVEKGQRFKLQSCVIEIEKVSRKIIKGKPAEWQATFIRHEQERIHLLRFTPPTRAPRTDDGDLGLTETERARLEGNYTGTTYSAMPHEPESVGPDWVDNRAGERELQRQEERRARMTEARGRDEADKAVARFKHELLAKIGKGKDLTPLLDDIFERLASEEQKAA